MSTNTVNQQNQQLHYSPLPLPFESKQSLIHRESTLKSICKINTNYYNYDPPHLKTTCQNKNFNPSKTFLDTYIIAIIKKPIHSETSKIANLHCSF